MVRGNRPPGGLGLQHSTLQGHHLLRVGRGLNTKIRSEARPQPLPAEYVPVNGVEVLVGCRRAGGCPFQLLGQQASIGHVRHAVPLLRGSWEDKGPAFFPAQGGVHCQRLAHIHGIAQRIADNGMRTMHAPAIAILLGSREKRILLGIVEVLHRLSTLLFTERGHRYGTFAVGFKRTKIVLKPGDQRHVRPVQTVTQRLNDVFHHRTVHADILFLTLLTRPDAKEERIRFDRLQRLVDRRRIGQIRRQAGTARQHVAASA